MFIASKQVQMQMAVVGYLTGQCYQWCDWQSSKHFHFRSIKSYSVTPLFCYSVIPYSVFYWLPRTEVGEEAKEKMLGLLSAAINVDYFVVHKEQTVVVL